MKRKRSHLKLWKLYRLSKNTVGNLVILNSGKTVRGNLRNSSNQMVHLLYGRFWHWLFWLSENYLLGGPAQICVPFFCTWKFWYLPVQLLLLFSQDAWHLRAMLSNMCCSIPLNLKILTPYLYNFGSFSLRTLDI